MLYETFLVIFGDFDDFHERSPKIMKLDHQTSWNMFHLIWWFLVINREQSWFPNSNWERYSLNRNQSSSQGDKIFVEWLSLVPLNFSEHHKGTTNNDVGGAEEIEKRKFLEALLQWKKLRGTLRKKNWEEKINFDKPRQGNFFFLRGLNCRGNSFFIRKWFLEKNHFCKIYCQFFSRCIFF